MPLEAAAQRHLGDSILYLSSLLRPAKRHIDQYIDYFGGTTPRTATRRMTRSAGRRSRTPRLARS
jgi:hypothetical protein